MGKKKLVKAGDVQARNSDFNNRGDKPAHFNQSKPQYTQRNNPSDVFFNPYSFIPLSNKVYALSEIEKKKLKYIHDIPFSESMSGVLTIDFEAKSPICVRSGDDEISNAAYNGKYYIPGSSIKGMIRNVFDIITYANIKHSSINDRYSIRDLRRSPTYELKAVNKPLKGGILIQYQGDYYVIPCKHERYTYGAIKEITNCYLKSISGIEAKYAALAKYVQTINGRTCIWLFSGDMSNKKGEYSLEIPNIESEQRLIRLEEEELNDFLFIHQIENENISWAYWKKRMRNYTSLDDIKKDNYKGVAPCFFRTKKKQSGKEVVRDLGFAFLYRQPYTNAIHDCLPKEHKTDEVDLTQAVFGYSQEKNSLKGRLRFSNAFINNAEVIEPQFHILNSPKPTFYPFYLTQTNRHSLNTYFAKDAIISGWKRYLIQDKAQLQFQVGDKAKIESKFIPLKEGTKFSSNIWYHNLRPFELGALISAINFCGKNDCFHSLGFAKPYGFGKVSAVNIQGKDYKSKEKINILDLTDKFEKHLFERCKVNGKSEWHSYLTNLFLFASGKGLTREIRYPILGERGNNEFVSISNKKQSIKDYSPTDSKQ